MTDTALHTDTMTVRHLDVDLSQGFERHWNGGDAYRSTVFNALSFMFPVGEQFFIDSVRRFAKNVEQQGQTELLRDIKLFIGQEATHRHLHKQYNDQLIKMGYGDWVERTLEKVIAFFGNKTPRADLAATVAYEHYTALLGDGLLRYASWTENMDPAMKAAWMWHAAEESEHKAVAFDTYQATGGGYLLRVLMFLFVSFEFFTYTFVQTSIMLRHDGQLLKWRTWRSAISMWWGQDGIVWHTLPHWLAYFKPGFHPWQHDNHELLHRWQHDHASEYRALNDAAQPTQPTPQGA
jgi:predicted metal-dependent hydrolase